MPITPLPTPVPSRADPANFAERGDAFLAALPTFAAETEAARVEINGFAATCESAAQTVNVSAWVSGTTYSVGDNRFDPVTFLTYRRKTAGAGTTRPGLDDTNWRLLTGFGDVDSVSTQTIGGVKTFSSPIAVASGGTGASTAAAAFNAIKQVASETATGVVEKLTTAEGRAGTDNTRYHSAATMKAAQIQNGTAVTLTAQTTVDFTGIPSWVKRITVMFSAVSTSGTSSILVQIGDSGGIEIAGYFGAGTSLPDVGSGGATNSLYTTGFGIRQVAASQVSSGRMVLELLDSTTWVANAVIARSDSAVVLISAGSKALSGTLDRIRITTVNGTDQFDAGAVNISYE